MNVQHYFRKIEQLKLNMDDLSTCGSDIVASLNQMSVRIKAVFLAVTQQLSNAQAGAWQSSAAALMSAVSEILQSESPSPTILNQNSSDNARADVSTMEVLIGYYTETLESSYRVGRYYQQTVSKYLIMNVLNFFLSSATLCYQWRLWFRAL